MLIVYLCGLSVVAAFLACCFLAEEGDERAEVACSVVVTVFVALGSAGFLLGFVLIFASRKLDGGGWFSQGQGQQISAASLAVILLVVAAIAVWRKSYMVAAALTALAAGLFVLWGLLLEAAWSARGPLAVVGMPGL